MSGTETSHLRTEGPADRLPGRDRCESRDLAITELRRQVRIAREKIANLELALQTARRIGAAVGILMVTEHATEERAFEMLRVASNTGSRKLREIADELVFTGKLPPADR